MPQLKPPVSNFNWKLSTNQMFGVNFPVYFTNFGIPGHNGLDIAAYYGQPILAAHDGYIGAIINDDSSHTKGNGIYLTSIDGTFSTIYWHLSKFNVVIGQTDIKTGDVIGFAGNSGFVNPKPTPQYPHAGTHLHFGLKIWGKQNDYGGYVDPVPSLYRPGDKLPIYLNSNLFLGISGDQVSWLQTMLELEGLAKDYDPVGKFGSKTLRDVMAFQLKNNLIPFPMCGPKTKALLNTKYS